jgi:hypothetical protein
MAVTQVLGDNVVFQTRDAETGGTWKTWVCNTTLSGTLSSEVETTTTKCGVIKSVGQLGGTINFSGVANATPETDQISLKDAISYAANQTLLEGRMINLDDTVTDDGEAVFFKADGYVTSITPNSDAGGKLSFDAVFELTGAIDIEESDES